MKEETPKCNSCGQSMLKIGGIGKSQEVMEFDKPITKDREPLGISMLRQTGIREEELYQCPECKDVKIY